jgi:hypothetical protein
MDCLVHAAWNQAGLCATQLMCGVTPVVASSGRPWLTKLVAGPVTLASAHLCNASGPPRASALKTL